MPEIVLLYSEVLMMMKEISLYIKIRHIYETQ